MPNDPDMNIPEKSSEAGAGVILFVHFIESPLRWRSLLPAGYAFQTFPGATGTAAITFRVSTMQWAQSPSS